MNKNNNILIYILFILMIIWFSITIINLKKEINDTGDTEPKKDYRKEEWIV